MSSTGATDSANPPLSLAKQALKVRGSNPLPVSGCDARGWRWNGCLPKQRQPRGKSEMNSPDADTDRELPALAQPHRCPKAGDARVQQSCCTN